MNICFKSKKRTGRKWEISNMSIHEEMSTWFIFAKKRSKRIVDEGKFF
jgi:hypothetical protein